MLRFISSAMLLISNSTPVLSASPAITAERSGYKFSYSTELMKSGAVELRGQLLGSRDSFTLVLDEEGLVTGNIGQSSVRFSVPLKKRNAIVARLTENSPALMHTAQSTELALKGQ